MSIFSNPFNTTKPASKESTILHQKIYPIVYGIRIPDLSETELYRVSSDYLINNPSINNSTKEQINIDDDDTRTIIFDNFKLRNFFTTNEYKLAKSILCDTINGESTATCILDSNYRFYPLHFTYDKPNEKITLINENVEGIQQTLSIKNGDTTYRILNGYENLDSMSQKGVSTTWTIVDSFDKYGKYFLKYETTPNGNLPTTTTYYCYPVEKPTDSDKNINISGLQAFGLPALSLHVFVIGMLVQIIS